eukprot:CAMPEP_0178900758 /NCGR_PEP_ID=MMETSP0786-20121207/3645_1 /TAXON_ID=186022 /ORGANISM="Thalassionema frauenfeldii, Strain CCMP 1798" /LENGTH=311 /DNA_ID=CAMNT_0020571785 /DNA_START=106 /DNA_END=1039 /DNA_ORIENTATION=-
MLTRQMKRQKIEEKKLDSLAAVFLHLVEFICTNDISNLGMVCKEFRTAVKSLRDVSSWNVLYEEREGTLIGYNRDQFDFLGIFPLDNVTVSQVQPFKFYISKKDEEQVKPPKRMVVGVHLQNKLWEECHNQKVRDLDVSEQATTIHVYGYTYEDNVVTDVYKFWTEYISIPFTTVRKVKYGGRFLECLQNDSKEHQAELRLMLSIMYECMKRISSWSDETSLSYPSAEYLMSLLPSSFWPFFPEGFDRETTYSDRTSVPEFTYHQAPSREEWLDVMPEREARIYVDSIPWYNGVSSIKKAGGQHYKPLESE